MKNRRITKPAPLLGLIAALLLAACGGKTQAGVSLQPVQLESAPPAASSPTPSPTPPVTSSLPGRLLYLKGGHIEIRTLATGSTQTITAMRAYSPVVLDRNAARGVFVAFPDLGVVDLDTGTVRTVPGAASDPTSYGISPDGKWLVVANGSYAMRLILVNAADLSQFTVANQTRTLFDWAWTADSRLVWAEHGDAPQWMIFDPGTQRSTPVSPLDLSLVIPQLSPDGKKVAQVPIAAGAAPGEVQNAQSADCFDSSVILSGVSTFLNDQPGQVLWTDSGLVAASPQWLTPAALLFVKLGSGTCGNVTGDPVREIMMIDTTSSDPQPRPLAGPLGNADDPNDRVQQISREVAHLYSPSPDGRYVAWISGGVQSGETAINITEVATGSTQTLLRFTPADAGDAADYLENTLIRQVLWIK